MPAHDTVFSFLILILGTVLKKNQNLGVMWGTLFEVKPERMQNANQVEKHLVSVRMEELYEFRMAAVANYHNIV